MRSDESGRPVVDLMSLKVCTACGFLFSGSRSRPRVRSVTGWPCLSVTIASTVTESMPRAERRRLLRRTAPVPLRGRRHRRSAAHGIRRRAVSIKAHDRGAPRASDRRGGAAESASMIHPADDNTRRHDDPGAARPPDAAERRRTPPADSVREFADPRSARWSARWTSTPRFRRALIDKLFELGVMGIEIPETHGGGGGTLLPCGARRRGAVARRSVGRRARGRAEHARHQRASCGGARDDQKRDYLPRLATDTVGAYALSEAGSGSDAFALQTRAARATATASCSPAASSGSPTRNEADIFIVFANVDPDAGYRGITAFLVERGTPGFTVGKKEDKLGIRASSTCELLLEDCRVPTAQRARRGRQGLQGRDRDAERGPHRHRRADARPGAQGALDHAVPLLEGAQAVRQGDRRVPGRAVPAGARGDRHRSGAAAGLQRRAPARRRPAVPHRGGDVQDLRVGGRRARRRRSPSTCSAATAS